MRSQHSGAKARQKLFGGHARMKCNGRQWLKCSRRRTSKIVAVATGGEALALGEEQQDLRAGASCYHLDVEKSVFCRWSRKSQTNSARMCLPSFLTTVFPNSAGSVRREVLTECSGTASAEIGFGAVEQQN